MEQPNASSCRRILIVDDNHAIHKDFEKILCSDEDSPELAQLQAKLFGNDRLSARPIRFNIDHAYQGREALDMVAEALHTGTP